MARAADVAAAGAPVSESRLRCLDNSCEPVFFLPVSGVLDELAKLKSSGVASKRRPADGVPRSGDVSEPLGGICLPTLSGRLPTLSDSVLESDERPESLREPVWRRLFLSDARSGSGAPSSSSDPPRVFLSLLPCCCWWWWWRRCGRGEATGDVEGAAVVPAFDSGVFSGRRLLPLRSFGAFCSVQTKRNHQITESRAT